MTPTTDKKELQMVRGSSLIVLLAGLWFFISPWVYRAEMMRSSWNSWVIGAVMVILAAFRMGNPIGTASLSWINCFLGVWAFISPWVYGYTPDHGLFVNSLCVGVIVFIAAITSASKSPHAQHPITTHS
jgi:SPW repeat